MLLVLLPLQAMAAAVLCPHASAAPATAAESMSAPAMEHCSMSKAAMDALAGDNSNSQPGDQDQHSCCTATAACAMCSMAINTRPASKSVGNHEQPGVVATPQYTSFIPEGLQRPPSILA